MRPPSIYAFQPPSELVRNLPLIDVVLPVSNGEVDSGNIIATHEVDLACGVTVIAFLSITNDSSYFEATLHDC